MILNVTYNGISIDYDLALDARVSDAEIRRIASEVVRASGHAFRARAIDDRAFRDYVVDRLTAPNGERRIYLRPKVPFGGGGGGAGGA